MLSDTEVLPNSAGCCSGTLSESRNLVRDKRQRESRARDRTAGQRKVTQHIIKVAVIQMGATGAHRRDTCAVT